MIRQCMTVLIACGVMISACTGNPDREGALSGNTVGSEQVQEPAGTDDDHIMVVPEGMAAYATAVVQASFSGTLQESMLANADTLRWLNQGMLCGDSLQRQAFVLCQGLLFERLEGEEYQAAGGIAARFVNQYPCEFGSLSRFFTAQLMDDWAEAITAGSAELNIMAANCGEESEARIRSLQTRVSSRRQAMDS